LEGNFPCCYEQNVVGKAIFEIFVKIIFEQQNMSLIVLIDASYRSYLYFNTLGILYLHVKINMCIGSLQFKV